MTLRNSVVPVTAASLTGMTLNQVAFGNSTGGLQGSANLTFNGSTLTLTGTQSVSGQLTSTVATGTAPFVVASTTAVANLNASLLLGGTWASPGAIGSTAPNTGQFTTLTTTQNSSFGSSASIDTRYVVSIQDTHTAADSVYRGLEIVTTHQGAVGSASTGIDVIHSTSGSNNMDHIVGAQIRPVHGSTGTLLAATGVFSRIDVSAGAGAITDLKLFYGFNGTFSGTAPVNNYGLYLESITGGSVLNYAIFTNTGLVKFGDTTDATSSTVGGVVTSGGLAVAKKLYTGDTTAATAVGTASVVFAGGISAAKDCYFGGVVNAKTTDSGTASQATTWVNNHKSTGTPAAFFGTAYRWRASSTTTDDRDQGVLLCYWTDATDATRKAALDWYVYDTTSRGYLYVAADGARANIQFLNASGASGQFGGGSGVIGITSCTTPPSSNPTGGGVLYVDAGALKYRGSSGTVTTIAPA